MAPMAREPEMQSSNSLDGDLPERLERLRIDAKSQKQELAAIAEGCESNLAAHSPTAQSVSDEFSNRRLRRRQQSMGADFITASPKEQQHELGSSWRGKARRWAKYIVDNNYNTNSLALVVLFDAYLTANDIDARAAGQEPSAFVRACSDICLLLYTAELPLLFFVRGRRILKDWMVLLDIVIIACGYAEWVLTSAGDALTSRININMLRPLRLARIIRLMQFLRKTRSLKELQKLVTMLATCLKTLVWSFLFGFVVMTMWAMLMVEIVHPLIHDVQERTNVFGDCGRQCLQAASSVMNANLLLFKTVVAGDSWGLIAIPVIQDHPATAIIFVGSLLTLVFGVLQLMVAVVVDTFAEVRENDVVNLAAELEHSLKNDRKYLQKIFDRLDESGTGELTLQNLMDGARKDAEFQSRLRVMDIDEVDLQQLFEMIDADGSGAIEAAEFIAPLSRWVRDSKTAPRFIKYNLQQTMQTQEELLKMSQYGFAVMNQRIEELFETLRGLDLDCRGAESASPGSSAKPAAASAAERFEPHQQVAPDESELFDLDGSIDGQNLEQPHDSAGRKSSRCSSGEVRRHAGPGPYSAGLESTPTSGSDGYLRNALRETMLALESSLSKATDLALKQSFAIAEQVLQDHLSGHDQNEHRSSRRSSRHWGQTTSISTFSMTSLASIEDQLLEIQGQAAQRQASRRNSVTNKLWTDF